MKFSDLTLTEQLEYATRQIIVHSIIYYELNYNCIDDKKYDAKLKWVYNFVMKHPDIAKNCYYANALKDIDPNTGFDLKDKLDAEHREYLYKIAMNVIKLHKEENGKKGR